MLCNLLRRSISMSYLRISSVDSTDGQNLPPYEDSVSQVGPLSNIRYATPSVS